MSTRTTMVRRMLAGLALAIVTSAGLAQPAAASVPTLNGFCKAAIANGTPPPPGTPPWVIVDAVFTAFEPTHLTAKCTLSWRGTPNRYLVCTQYATLWWNGLWSFSTRDCDLYSIPG